MRGNPLPVSGARWQHGSLICFATFIKGKIPKNSTTTEVREKIRAVLECLEF
jgi:hypothetical protein